MVTINKEIKPDLLKGYREVVKSRFEKESEKIECFTNSINNIFDFLKKNDEFYTNLLLSKIASFINNFEKNNSTNIKELKYKISRNDKYVDYIEDIIRLKDNEIKRLSYALDNSEGRTK